MRRWLIDASLALLLLAVGAVQLTLRAVPDERGFTKGGVLAAAVLVVMTVPLIARRRFPRTVFVLVTAAALLGSPVFHARETSAEAVAHGLALFTLVEVAALPWTLVGAAASVVISWLHTQQAASFVYNLAFYALVWSGGYLQRDRAVVQRELEDRAEQLEDEREKLRQAAVASERARISAELRGVVAAEVDAMAADAQAAREGLGHGVEIQPVLEQIEERGRRTLGELRHLLAVLRLQEETEVAAPPSPVKATVVAPASASPLVAWFVRRPGCSDLLLCALLAGGLALEIVQRTVPSTGTLAVVSTSCAIAMLLVRRRLPIITLAGVCAVIVLQQATLMPPLTTALLTTYMVAVYGVAVACRRGWALLAVLGGAAAYAPHAPDARVAAATVLFTGSVAVFAAALGWSARERAHLIGQLAERVAELNATRQRRAEMAVAEERGRVAREMHDLVAHGVSLMVIQAGAAQSVLAGDPARAAEILDQLQRAASETHEETRLMLAGLEGEETDELPQRDLRNLGRQLRSAGLNVVLREQGQPRALGPGLQLSLYRIAQEALTNVRKHAPGAAAEVHVHYGEDAVGLAVRNGPPAAGQHPAVGLPGAGHGLLGMRERVSIFSGRLQARALEDGGFEVHAEIPVPTG